MAKQNVYQIEGKTPDEVKASRYGEKGKIRRDHLSQILTYVMNQENDAQPNTKDTRGILVYPAVDTELTKEEWNALRSQIATLEDLKSQNVISNRKPLTDIKFSDFLMSLYHLTIFSQLSYNFEQSDHIKIRR